MTEPLVTIVMPTFKRSTDIGQSLRSLQEQDLADFELLVRDDGDGNDGTREVVEAAMAHDDRIRYARNPRQLGMPGNLNGGIAEAQGTYVAVCHDHDQYAPTFLSRMVGTLRTNPKASYVHCGIRVVDAQGQLVARHVANWPKITAGRVWLRYMLSRLDCPVCALTMVSRETYRKHGLYDPQYGFIADVEMWLRLSTVGDVAYISEPLIDVRDRRAAVSAAPTALRNLSLVASMQRRYLKAAFLPPARYGRRMTLEARILKARVNVAVRQVAHRVLDDGRRLAGIVASRS